MRKNIGAVPQHLHFAVWLSHLYLSDALQFLEDPGGCPEKWYRSQIKRYSHWPFKDLSIRLGSGEMRFSANAGFKNSFDMRFSSVHIQKRFGKGHLLRLRGDWIDRSEAVVKNSVSPLNLG